MFLNITNNNNLLSLQYYLILSIPFLIISGPFLSDLAVIICSLSFLIYVFKNNELKFLKSLYFRFILIFYLYLIASSLMSEHILFSLKSSSSYLRFGLFSLSIWLVLEHKPRMLINLFYIFLLIYVFLAVDGLKQYFTQENLFGVYLASGHRVTSLFGEEAVLGSYLSRFFPLFFALLVFFYEQRKKKIYFYIFGFLFIIIDVLIFVTAERTALFLINFAALIFMITLNNYKKIRLITLISSIFAFALISLYYPAAKIRIIDQTLDQLGLNKSKVQFLLSKDEIYKEHVGINFSDDKRIYIFSKQYDDIYRTSLNIFNENKLFGIGPKNFRKFCNNSQYLVGSGCSTHPHNTYIQILTETGIIGLLFLVSIFLLVIYNFAYHINSMYLRNKPHFNDFQIALLVGIFLSIWPLIPSGNFFNNWINIIYYYPVGFLLWSFSNYRNNM